MCLVVVYSHYPAGKSRTVGSGQKEKLGGGGGG